MDQQGQLRGLLTGRSQHALPEDPKNSGYLLQTRELRDPDPVRSFERLLAALDQSGYGTACEAMHERDPDKGQHLQKAKDLGAGSQ